MKTTILILIMAATGFFSCGQANKSTPETADIETINSVRNYEYADSMGKHLIIENGGPKGEGYTDSTGKEYFKAIFWTIITNETDNPVELKIDFPENSYEVPGLQGKYYKILVPPDTMTLDKKPLYSFGITDLKSFLDNNIDKQSSLKRTINPNESNGFYVLLLSLRKEITPGGTIRTGLILKGQNLFYRISRYSSKAGHPLISEKEINCGRINLKGLVLRK